MGACTGWTVVELGAASAASSVAGMLFADNGARVVKLEPPSGDRLRRDLPSGFLVWNRGKESLVADLTTEAGRATARDAIVRADVLLAGVPHDRLASWGLSWDDLRDANPALVHCVITGFGPTGPYASLRAYDAVVSAKTGLLARGGFGFRDGPIFYDTQWASIGAAHQAFAGALAALIVRERTGRGQHLDATLYAGISALDYFTTMHFQHAQKHGGPSSASGAVVAMRNMLYHATSDSRFITTTGMQLKEMQALCRVTGQPELLDEPRFAKAPKFDSAEDAQEWEMAMWRAFRAKPYAEWLEILRGDPDIAFETLVTSEEALDHPQIVHNGEVVDVEGVRMVGPLARFEKSPSRIDRLAPAIGDNAGPLTGPAAPEASAPAPEHALGGITIVECGYFFAMPFGLTMAASLGARVIKVEPKEGDPFRNAFGYPETTGARVMEGKESLSIDIATPQGREVMHRLLASADAFVTSFRPGVPERLGLDYDTIRKLNPSLVYVHATGYGSSGPYVNRAMYAGAASAAAGSYNRHAGPWLDPARTIDWPVEAIEAVIKPRLGVPTDGDSNAALAVLSALLVGLAHRARTGEGQLVETSMLGGNAYMYSDDFCTYAGKPPRKGPDEDNYGLNALYRVYEAADGGWIFLAATTEREWVDLVKALGAGELASDERFATADARDAHDADLVAELAPRVATRTADEWEASLNAAGVGCAAVCMTSTSAFTCTDEVLLATGLTAEVEHPLFGTIRRHGLPVLFSETPGRLAAGCLRGEHNESILAGAGYTADEIAALVAEGVVNPPAAPTPGR